MWKNVLTSTGEEEHLGPYQMTLKVMKILATNDQVSCPDTLHMILNFPNFQS